MGLHSRVFVCGQLSRFLQDIVGDAHLSDVMQRSRLGKKRYIKFGQVRVLGGGRQLPGKNLHIALGAANVLPGVLVPGLGQHGHADNDLVLRLDQILGADAQLAGFDRVFQQAQKAGDDDQRQYRQ